MVDDSHHGRVPVPYALVCLLVLVLAVAGLSFLFRFTASTAIKLQLLINFCQVTGKAVGLSMFHAGSISC